MVKNEAAGCRGNSDFFNYLPERWGRLGLPLGNVA